MNEVCSREATRQRALACAPMRGLTRCTPVPTVGDVPQEGPGMGPGQREPGTGAAWSVLESGSFP